MPFDWLEKYITKCLNIDLPFKKAGSMLKAENFLSDESSYFSVVHKQNYVT